MEKKGIKVRFPNESFFDNVKNFKLEHFQLKNTFENEVFGKWMDTYVFIDLEDYKKLKYEQVNR